MSHGDYRRLVRLLPQTYRARREQELLTVISDASQGAPHRARGDGQPHWTRRPGMEPEKLVGLDGAEGPAARRLLAWLLPVALVLPIAVWVTEGLVSPLLNGWPPNLTWDPSWRSWLLWALALCLLALGRLRASAVAGALAMGTYAAVRVHIASRNNPKSVVEGVGWFVLQSAAVLAIATAPDVGRKRRAWRRRLVPLAVAMSRSSSVCRTGRRSTGTSCGSSRPAPGRAPPGGRSSWHRRAGAERRGTVGRASDRCSRRRLRGGADARHAGG